MAIGYGQGIMVNVSGATDAAAILTGTMIGSVSGNDFAALIALGGFISGSVTSSAGDGLIFSEGAINGSLSVAQDGGLYAYGDITGSHSAGNDISAVTFGTFNGSLSAGRDVLGVVTGSNLLGSITADRNIVSSYSMMPASGGILSYGEINANISALNLVSDPSGGIISNVTASGSISGSITAAGMLGGVMSGADILATISAGTPGSVIDWNSDTASATPPLAPASIAASLLAQVATARTQVVNDKNDSYNTFLTLVADVATAQSNAASDIAMAQSDVVAQTAQAISDSVTDLSNAQSAAAPQFTSGQTAALANAQTNLTAFEAAVSNFDVELATQATAHNVAQLAAQRDAASLAIKIASNRIEVTIDKAKAADEFHDQLTSDRNWIGKWPPSFEAIVSALTDAVNPVKIVREKVQQWGQMSALADEAQLSGVRRYHMIIGSIVAEMVGIKQLVGAFDGADPYTLQKWGTAERILNGVLGGFTLVTTAFGISAFMSRMTSACGSVRWGSCFTADMLAENPPEAQTQVMTTAGRPDVDSETASSWFGAAFAIATIGLGSGYLLMERQRICERKRRSQQTIDALFGGNLLDDVLMPTA